MPGVVWATLFLVLSAVFVSPALAQTTFVSNTGQTVGSDNALGPATGNDWQHGLPFTTGSHAAGYTLSEVDVLLADNSAEHHDVSGIRVSIYNVNSSGQPTTSLYELTSPSSFTDDAVNTFTAPSNATLAANTTYAVYLDSISTKETRIQTTQSDDEDAGGQSGWSIADSRYLTSDGSTWFTPTAIPMIAIKGTEKTTSTNNAPTVANAIQDQTATVGTMFSFAFPANTFSDADNETLTYTATKSDGMALPAWLSFADSTRTFSGTPTAADVGTLSVKVTASDGTDSVSDTFDIEVSAAAAPGQVTGVSVTPGVGSLAVSWTAVTGATGYKVQWKSGSQNYDATNRQATVGAVTSHTIPSLTAGTQYTVRVIATKTNANDGTPSAEKTGTPKAAAPGQVTGVSVAAGVGSLDVSWTAVTGATGYKVQWKSGSQNYDSSRQASVGAVTSHTIPSLTAGTQYAVRVIATKTNADDGTPSSEKTGTPKVAAPGQVTGVSVSAGVGTLDVSWTAVSGATGYKVQWKSGAENYDSSRQSSVGTVTSHTIPSLTAGTQYTVRVIATKTNADDGPSSNDATGTPKAVTPGQVTGVSVSAGVGTLDVSWTAVTGATGYKVQWKSGAQDYDGSRQGTVGAVTSHTIPSLTAGTQYTVRVIATKTNADDGTPSAEVTGTPKAAAPAKVTGVSVAAGVGTLDVSWTAVTGATGYKVQWKSGAQNYDATNRQATVGAVTSHTIPSLTAGTQYTVRVIATKTNADDGPASDDATGTPMTAAPGQVTGVSATQGVGSLDVSWTAVTGATGYKVQWKSGSQNYDATNRQAVVGAVTSHTIPSLTAGTQYTVRVIATLSNANDGTPSAEVTGTPKAAAPAQVTGVSVSAGVGTLDVSWTAVTGATGYKVQWKSGSQDYDSSRQSAVGAVTNHTIPSLTAGTQYTVRVIATKTNADDGTPSAEATGTPKAAAPAQVTGVTATPGVGTLDVSWTSVTGATGYKVQWKSGSQNYDSSRQTTVGAVTKHTISSLTAGTQYTVRVIATKTNADDGQASSEVTGIPKAAAPGQVTGVSATPGVGSLAVSWDAVSGATGYKVQWKSGSQNYDPANRQATVTGTGHTIPSLTAGTQYMVRVIATLSNADDGPASAEVTGIPKAASPGQVTGVRVAPGVGTLVVSWDAVSSATGYKVQWKSGAENYDTTNRQAAATGTSHTIQNLAAGTEYTVRVIATLSNADDGTPSAEVTGTPRAASVPPPPPPPDNGGDPTPSSPLTTEETIDVGETTYEAGDHEVTVRREAGTPAVRLALPGRVAGDVEVTISAVAPDVPLESGTFGLGPAGAETAVDVDVDNVPAGGLTLCLPVSAALLEAAADEPLVLLHWRDGDWTEVPGTALNPAGTHVCATVTSFSPFAVGYRADVAPRFDRPAPSLVLADGEAMDPVVLPEATGGDGELTYTLASEPAGLAGLSFNAATRRLSGTPDAAGEYGFTYTAHDADANRAESDAAVLTFTVTVEDPRTAQVRQSVRRTLAAVARRSLTSALDNIGARFAASVPGPSLTLAGETVPLGAIAGSGGTERFCSPGSPDATNSNGTNRGDCVLVTRGMTSEELLHASAFTLTLGAAGGAENTGTGAPPSPQWAVWGRGDLGTFAGRPEPGMGYEGELRTGWLGVDARAGAWVMGLALSHGTGEADYDFADGGVSGQGRLETSLTALYPYGRWTLSEGLEVRGVLGAGSGEARHRLDGGTGETSERSDLSMWMGSVGLRRAFPSLGEIDLAARADASLARMETDDGPAHEHIANLTADSWRLRAGVEASRRFALDGDAALEPFVEAAARRDGGDGLEGTGLEIAGGVRYTAPRLHLEMRGRWLASHSEEGAEESGVSVTARLGPGAQGRGLSLSLNPRWGAGTGGAEALWREDLPGPAGSGSTASMDARIGYGFSWTPYGLDGWNGLLTPFAETGISGHSGNDSRRLRLGARFEASRMNLGVELAGERRENGTAGPEHALRLDLGLRF